jgi:hypothetical protein
MSYPLLCHRFSRSWLSSLRICQLPVVACSERCEFDKSAFYSTIANIRFLFDHRQHPLFIRPSPTSAFYSTIAPTASRGISKNCFEDLHGVFPKTVSRKGNLSDGTFSRLLSGVWPAWL